MNGNSNTGGSVPTDPLRYIANDPVVIIGNTGSRTQTGHAMTSWNTAADGSGSSYAAGTASFAMPANDLTLFAQWTQVP